jgi:thiol-disulfide isomerase/thioredoxin
MAPSRRKVLMVGAVGVAAAAAGALVALGLRRSADRSSEALQAATFVDLSGKTRRLAEWKGKIVVCNFWATWCPPCREEIPMLISVSEKMGPKGVEVVGIAVDFAAKVRSFVRDYKISYPVLLAGDNGIDLMRAAGNGVGGLPYTTFLDRQGRIVHEKLGALTGAEVDAQLHKMLRS